MSDPLQSSIRIAGYGLHAQSIRVRVVSENIANALTTASAPNAEPYRRKTVTFGEVVSVRDAASHVSVASIGRDASPFHVINSPGHPAANGKGEVFMPNVDPALEMADLRDANHSYQAGLQIVRQARELLSMTLDMLKT